ncbi:MAG TPA: hypothetical protein VMS43_13240 [Allosphingosinicella sp.]|nr:hypothetical protein [Allosphingosinicella sp.]
MRILLFGMSAAVLTLVAGCSTLTAPDEVKALKGATTNFTSALRASEAAGQESAEAEIRGRYRRDMLAGHSIAFDTNCYTRAAEVNDNLDALIIQWRTRPPYDPAASDRAYRTIRGISPCDLPELATALPELPAPRPYTADVSAVVSLDADTLGGAAQNLEAYVEALSDIAGGETSGRADAARAELFEAGRGLIGALKIGGPADLILNVAEAAIGSIIAARRNAHTREFLDRMDPAMPAMMERLGLAARVVTAQAAYDRAQAARYIALHANEALRQPGMFVRRGRQRVASPERIRTYDDAVQRLEIENNALKSLRRSDPMVAARAFAAAHHELKEVFHNPRAHRAALAAGLKEFQDSAVALITALRAR